MLSPALVELNRDSFLADETPETTGDLDAQRSETTLEDLDLGDLD